MNPWTWRRAHNGRLSHAWPTQTYLVSGVIDLIWTACGRKLRVTNDSGKKECPGCKTALQDADERLARERAS